MTKVVGIIGSALDAQIAPVAAALRDMGVRAVILDHTACSSIDFTIGAEAEAGQILPECDVIWWRAKFGHPRFGEGPEFEAEFVAGEAWHGALRNLAHLRRQIIVNHPSAASRAAFKLEQLRVARQVGLRVPETLLTNDPDRLLAWAAARRGVIAKAIAPISVPKADAAQGRIKLMTRRIDTARILDNPEAIRLAPIFFQEEIEKLHELRIVVHGDRIYPFHINSQEFASTEVDWTYGQGFLRFELCEIPPKLAEKIMAFMREMELFEGHFDFAVDKAGDPVFFECNPFGMWGWLDRQATGQLSRSMAGALIERSKRGPESTSRYP